MVATLNFTSTTMTTVISPMTTPRQTRSKSNRKHVGSKHPIARVRIVIRAHQRKGSWDAGARGQSKRVVHVYFRLGQKDQPVTRKSGESVTAISADAERVLIDFMSDGNFATNHRKRKTLSVQDLDLVRKIKKMG